jgi:hypothetical protein
MLEIATISQSSGVTYYKEIEKGARLTLDETQVPQVHLDRPFPTYTLVMPFKLDTFESDVDFQYKNPFASQERKGRITALICRVRDLRLINYFASKVSFEGESGERILRYFAFSDPVYEFRASDVDTRPALIPKDQRLCASTLEGSFSEEMEAEFKRLLDLCPSICWDLEYCLNLLKKR